MMYCGNHQHQRLVSWESFYLQWPAHCESTPDLHGTMSKPMMIISGMKWLTRLQSGRHKVIGAISRLC